MSLSEIYVAKINREARGDEKQAVKSGARDHVDPLGVTGGRASSSPRPACRPARPGHEPDRDRRGEVRPRHQPQPLSPTSGLSEPRPLPRPGFSVVRACSDQPLRSGAPREQRVDVAAAGALGEAAKVAGAEDLARGVDERGLGEAGEAGAEADAGGAGGGELGAAGGGERRRRRAR